MRRVRGRECMEGVSAGERESRTEVALTRREGRTGKCCCVWQLVHFSYCETKDWTVQLFK